MELTIQLWILGLLIAWLVALTGMWQYHAIQSTKIKAALLSFSKDAAKILHSPHTPELDKLLEKYYDFHYELSWAEWQSLEKICGAMVDNESEPKQQRLIAAFLRAVCQHKLHEPPDKPAWIAPVIKKLVFLAGVLHLPK